MSSTARSFTPPRTLIIATPAGVYLTIRLAPALGWQDSALFGVLLLAFLLSLPALARLVRSARQSATIRAESKAAKKKEAGK
ncbi:MULTISPECIES: hypothetical protein [Streptacidiphilus]|uniref:DUF4229 domain-containing protein n=1 Tax=Streptacidiphilus cavernicola TaxID=3342716 RepID=A0ABV6UW93_9ACTN|nr:hypothetical protein [Streptacidiphilus jeojiense]